MRRRRGETSLFEILRGPGPERKKSWWNKSEEAAAADSASSSATNPPAQQPESVEPEAATPSSPVVSESVKRRNAVAYATPEVDAPLPARGFWAKVKDSTRTAAPEASAQKSPASKSQATQEAVFPNRIAALTESDSGEGDSREGDAEDDRAEPQFSAAESRVTEALPPLTELAEEERSTPAGRWDWLNNSVEVRFATILLYSVGVLLALFLAYHSGSSRVEPTNQELTKASEKPSYQIDTTPRLPREALREVRSKTGSPVPAPTEKAPGSASNRAKGNAASDRSGIVFATIKGPKAADTADNMLLQLKEVERRLGMRAKTRFKGRGRQHVEVYFGFADSNSANAGLAKIRRVRQTVKAGDVIADFGGAFRVNLE